MSRPTPPIPFPKKPRSRQERALRSYVRRALVSDRTHRGLLQMEAARLAGIGRGALEHIEQGRQLPSIPQLYRLARAYRNEVGRYLP